MGNVRSSPVSTPSLYQDDMAHGTRWFRKVDMQPARVDVVVSRPYPLTDNFEDEELCIVTAIDVFVDNYFNFDLTIATVNCARKA